MKIKYGTINGIEMIILILFLVVEINDFINKEKKEIRFYNHINKEDNKLENLNIYY